MADDIITKPFRLTLGDYLGFNLISYYGNLLTFPAVLPISIFILAPPFFGTANDLFVGERSSFFLYLALSLSFWLMVQPGISLLRIIANFEESPILRAERAASINDQGISLDGPSFSVTLTWAKIRKVTSSRRHIQVYINFAMAYLIPKSAFTSPDQANIFFTTAQAHCKNAKLGHVKAFYDDQIATGPTCDIVSPTFSLSFSRYAIAYLSRIYDHAMRPLMSLQNIIASTGLTFIVLHPTVRGWSMAAGSFIAIFALILLGPPLLFLPSYWRHERKHGHALEEQAIGLTPGYLVCFGESYRTELRWTDIIAIRHAFGMIQFYSQPTTAVVLPMSAFPDKLAAKAFYNQALAYFSAAKAPAAKSQLDGQA